MVGWQGLEPWTNALKGPWPLPYVIVSSALRVGKRVGIVSDGHN